MKLPAENHFIDAAKVPPSKFQKPEGSIYATPGSRGQLGKDRDKGFHEKLKTMLGKVRWVVIRLHQDTCS